MVPIEGWITLDTARDLFKRAGLDYDALKAAANKPGFKAVPMRGETLTAHAHSTISKMTTRNVVGVVRGRKRPNEYFLYTAHWDHLGVKPDVAGPDKIYNGAVDNGMGVSSILEIAEKFAKTKPAPQRSVAFIAWTMEEQGLLGSRIFRQASDLAAQPHRRRHQSRRQPAGGPRARHGGDRQRRLAAGRHVLTVDAENGGPRDLARSRAGEGLLLPLRPHQPRQGGRSDARIRAAATIS